MQEHPGKRITIETERILVITRRRTVAGSQDGSDDMEVLQAEAATRLFAMDQLRPPVRGKLPRGPALGLASCLKSLLRLFRTDGTGRDSSDLTKRR